MDSEQRFLSALLTAKKAEQQRFFLSQVPKGVFKLREKEAQWVYKYREKFRQYPSLHLFNTHFPEDRLKKHTDPLEGTLQPILDMAMFAQMRDVTSEVKEMLDGSSEVAPALAYFKESVARLTNYSTSYVDLNCAESDSAWRAYRELALLREQSPESLMQTPWAPLNKMVKYFLPGETCLWVARTSIGKTWVVAALADYFASRLVSTAFITKEMSTEAVNKRIEAIRYRLPWEAYRDGTISPNILRRWREERHKDIMLKKPYPLIVSGEETIEGVGLSHVISKIQQYQSQQVVVDGAYLIYPEGCPKQAKTHERLAFLSNRFKQIAKATNSVIHIVLQFNREAENKDGLTKGGLVNIANADAWAQDADWVVVMSGKRGSDVRSLELAKGRESAIGEFFIRFVLDPYPHFPVILGKSSAVKGSSVTFNGIK